MNYRKPSKNYDLFSAGVIFSDVFMLLFDPKTLPSDRFPVSFAEGQTLEDLTGYYRVQRDRPLRTWTLEDLPASISVYLITSLGGVPISRFLCSLNTSCTSILPVLTKG